MASTRARELRKAKPRDTEKICALHRASIQELCSDAYSAKQIAAWIEPFAPDLYLPLMDRLDFFVAEEKTIVGFCVLDLETAELNAIYVHPGAARRGVGRQLVELAESLAREQSLPRLKVKSTLNAIGFYEACGFTRASEALHDGPTGLTFPCVEMSKDL